MWYFDETINQFLANNLDYDVKSVVELENNPIPVFAIIEKRFSKDALLGKTITAGFINQPRGYEKDFFSCQLTSLKRSIDNLEINIVHAEYSTLLGYKPQVTIEEGLIRSIGWYWTHGHLPESNCALKS